MPLIQSIDRALQIINLFNESQPELKITEISKQLGLNKSTVHTILKTLKKYNYIDQNEETNRYKLGMKLFERGQCVINQLDLRTISRRYLEELSQTTGYTLHLVVLSGREGIYIDKVEDPSATIRYSRIGRRVPIHQSAVGKVLVAFEETNIQKEILENYVYTLSTPNTIGSEEEFLREIQKVKEQGYAMDTEENELGVVCLAVPILNYKNTAIASISLSMPALRFNQEEFPLLIDKVKAAGNEISRKMGYSGSCPI